MPGVASGRALLGQAVRLRELALRLQIVLAMGRFFLSGQTTCALLLGAGLLLRAQAAIRVEPEAPAPQAIETPGTRPAEMIAERAPRVRVVRNTTPERSLTPRRGKIVAHSRKGFAHRLRRHRGHRRGVALAGDRPRVG
jgi:hypothetical protein